MEVTNFTPEKGHVWKNPNFGKRFRNKPLKATNLLHFEVAKISGICVGW